jgi:hypothetical protein
MTELVSLGLVILLRPVFFYARQGVAELVALWCQILAWQSLI